MRLLMVILAFALSTAQGIRAESWREALTQMSLEPDVFELNRTNCVQVMLSALRSNQTVKALIFMPGATDELYFFRRVQVRLSQSHASLLDAVVALTNQSPLRATFRSPFLLLHSGEDVLDLEISVQHEATVEKLKRTRTRAHLVMDDRDWDSLLKSVKKLVKVGLRPWPHTRDSWHFYRHSFTAWNLTAWETLQAVALAGKTKFIVKRNRVEFEADERVGELPRLDRFPR